MVDAPVLPFILPADPQDGCRDCGVDVYAIGEYEYMVTRRTWQDANGGGLLCIGCIERRLGRELRHEDFRNLEFLLAGRQSDRLKSRLAGRVITQKCRLPRARALRHLLDELRIRVEVQGDNRPLPGEMTCTVRIRRGSWSTTTTVWTGWTTPAGAIEMIDVRARAFPHASSSDPLLRAVFPQNDWSPRVLRNIRRRAASAEMVMRALLTEAERERFRMLCELDSYDAVLPRDMPYGFLDAAKECRLWLGLDRAMNTVTAS